MGHAVRKVIGDVLGQLHVRQGTALLAAAVLLAAPSLGHGASEPEPGQLLALQGLGFDGAGNVLVAESSAGRLDLFIR